MLTYKNLQIQDPEIMDAVSRETKRQSEEMKKTKFTDWWQGLKKMTYKKLK